MENDLLGEALWDYQTGKYTEDIIVNSSLDDEDTLSLPYLFRTYPQMPKLEQTALENCKGTILDIGCGAGVHSLYLQKKGYEITALDQSPGAINVCLERGIKHVANVPFLSFDGGPFDTLLLLMNGIGIVGSLTRLDGYLTKMKMLLKPNGQILLDSSDILYAYDDDEDGGYWIPEDMDYYGEISFTLSYKNKKTTPFDWLYIDYNTLQRAAHYNGFNCELLQEGEHHDYLARLSIMK